MTPEHPEVRLIGLTALPEVTPGMDLAELARAAVHEAGETFRDGDALVVTHKIVAKAEGRLVDLRTVEPSDFARRWAERGYSRLGYFHEVEKGGHFAAWEEPLLFVSEMRAAFESSR